jgi:hypothetical protein
MQGKIPAPLILEQGSSRICPEISSLRFSFRFDVVPQYGNIYGMSISWIEYELSVSLQMP